jgi:outer membrane protein TolC
MEAQLKQNSILRDELQTNYDRFSALMQNGMANQSDLDAIRVEQLNVEQRRIGLADSERSYQAMLAAFIGEPISEEITLAKPDYANETIIDESINRPEIALFDAQIGLLEKQEDLLVTALFPRIGLFGQWSLGRPGVNPFEDKFSNWLVGGVRLNWGLSGVYSLRNNHNRIEKKAALARVQKETFLFTIEQQLTQQRSEIEKYRELIRSDDEIITLRGNVKRAAEARVENGTISVADLIKEINAENLAIQARSLHEIQLLMSINKLKNTTNK